MVQKAQINKKNVSYFYHPCTKQCTFAICGMLGSLLSPANGILSCNVFTLDLRRAKREEGREDFDISEDSVEIALDFDDKTRNGGGLFASNPQEETWPDA